MAPPTATRPKHMKEISLDLARVSVFDQVAGLLIALLVLIGSGVLVLLLIFLTTQNWETRVSIPVILESASGRGDHALGTAQDLELPGLDELDVALEPQIAASYEALTQAVTNQEAALENLEGTANTSDRGQGQGDSRPLGPVGDGPNIVPRWERWQIEFASTDLTTYARQLDFFQIELGAAGGGLNTIDYAANFSRGTPRTRKAAGDKEERLYFTWKSGSLREADLELLARAGVETSGRIPLQFYPAETENLLAHLEQQHLTGRPLESVRKTVFGIRPKEDGYEFYVRRQMERFAN